MQFCTGSFFANRGNPCKKRVLGLALRAEEGAGRVTAIQLNRGSPLEEMIDLQKLDEDE